MLRSRRTPLFSGTVGNVLGQYEWSAYAVFTPFVATITSDPSERVSALLSALAVFAAGLLVRPPGGTVLGRIAGRRVRALRLRRRLRGHPRPV
ncbi:hypothetical protein [Streptomyces bikiniensis]|uniref:hypothetical protein n=1 Tax=Streptomyces bikiniensis TaxID=1896 RepID=UPI0004BFC5F3|nr:hypothetical protein [Streptomyces bikiniensis]